MQVCFISSSTRIHNQFNYNYTENYRQGTHQAKRHHSGRGINTQLYLKMPSHTTVDTLVVNLHWSIANVNHIVDLGGKKNIGEFFSLQFIKSPSTLVHHKL